MSASQIRPPVRAHHPVLTHASHFLWMGKGSYWRILSGKGTFSNKWWWTLYETNIVCSSYLSALFVMSMFLFFFTLGVRCVSSISHRSQSLSQTVTLKHENVFEPCLVWMCVLKVTFSPTFYGSPSFRVQIWFIWGKLIANCYWLTSPYEIPLFQSSPKTTRQNWNTIGDKKIGSVTKWNR